jgi:hypothetical protein
LVSNLRDGERTKAGHWNTDFTVKEVIVMARLIGEIMVAIVGVWIIATLVVAFVHSWL